MFRLILLTTEIKKGIEKIRNILIITIFKINSAEKISSLLPFLSVSLSIICQTVSVLL
jgi:hypothetical protein